MNADLLMFFDKTPDSLTLYEAVADKICVEFKNVKVKIRKTQIAFAKKHKCIILTFGLGHQVVHPQIDVSTEPYPNRWTHHIVIKSVDEVDEQIVDWISGVYNFALAK